MATTEIASPSRKKGHNEWEVSDAMHTILRAGEHLKNESLMKEVRKHAAGHAERKKAEAKQAAHLAKAGRISPKQMAKLAAT